MFFLHHKIYLAKLISVIFRNFNRQFTFESDHVLSGLPWEVKLLIILLALILSVCLYQRFFFFFVWIITKYYFKTFLIISGQLNKSIIFLASWPWNIMSEFVKKLQLLFFDWHPLNLAFFALKWSAGRTRLTTVISFHWENHSRIHSDLLQYTCPTFFEKQSLNICYLYFDLYWSSLISLCVPWSSLRGPSLVSLYNLWIEIRKKE